MARFAVYGGRISGESLSLRMASSKSTSGWPNMIRNHEQFEAALAEGVRLLDAAPADGTPGHARLLALMKDIAAYRPTIQGNAQRKVSDAERLSQRLDAFQTRLTPRFSAHWHSMIGGDFGGPDR